MEAEPQAGNLLSMEQTGFTSCNYYFGSNGRSGRKKFLDLKQCREVHTLKEGFQTMEMRSIFMQDKRKQFLQQFYVVLQSKQGIGGEN